VLEPIDDLPAGVIGMRAKGQFTIEDFEQTVLSAVDRVQQAHGQLRLVLDLGPDFEGFGEGAWGELTREIRTIRFHRGAVVTDNAFVRRSLNIIKWTLRGQVRTFRNRELADAIAWVAR
jgi:hypothetical protein